MEDKKPAEATEAKVETSATTTQDATASSVATPAPKRNYLTYVAVALVVVALLAVWGRLEREGRVDTNVFGVVDGLFAGDPVVVTIDDEVLRESDLELSIEQLAQAAAAQGVDPTTEVVQTEIRTQAVDMLINTTLLTAAADERGVVITDEDITTRRVELEEAAGGADVLMARMEEFGITQEIFEADIRTELTIVQLLDQVFAEADLSVTDEEVQAVYDLAAAGGADVPALEEVRPQIEQQIMGTKEQDTVTAFIDGLRAAADIEIAE